MAPRACPSDPLGAADGSPMLRAPQEPEERPDLLDPRLRGDVISTGSLVDLTPKKAAHGAV